MNLALRFDTDPLRVFSCLILMHFFFRDSYDTLNLSTTLCASFELLRRCPIGGRLHHRLQWDESGKDWRSSIFAALRWLARRSAVELDRFASRRKQNLSEAGDRKRQRGRQWIIIRRAA
ncbi:MAG: hypothetical protein ACLPSF_14210 [Methylocella sp.]